MADHVQTVAVVGGGLVGALNACFLSQRGFKVDMYELRDDIRQQKAVKGRSINLALSCRGREALKCVGLEETMVANGIPMYARMIHDVDGSKREIAYGTKDQYIMSVDRRRLNELMLTGAEEQSGVTLHFDHKLASCDFDKGELVFQRGDGSHVTANADLIIGCDGAYSSVRQHVMKATRFDFSQEYIPHGYMELKIPAKKDQQYSMETNYLHIWPRDEFMMIALPNVEDRSFVVTLFMPFAIFDSLTNEAELIKFFETTFPDSIPLIGRSQLVESFFAVKPLPLVTVKCQPYNIGSRCVLMGDAAHAMVPFYGQGMNCGFEDCLVFDGLMEKYNNDLTKVLPEYSVTRNPDAKAMCDLALYNYVEMRSSVNSKMFLMRKYLDNFLHWLMPQKWVPLYTSVSFSRMRYHECISNRAWQDKLLTRILRVAGVTSTAVVAAFLYSQFNTQGGNLMDALVNNSVVQSVVNWK